MTKNEHAQAIKGHLFEVEAATTRLHAALAAAVVEYGEELGIDGGIVSQAAAPKKPPVNPS